MHWLNFWRVLAWLVALAFLLLVAALAFMWWHPVFGGKPDAQSLARIQASPQFDGQVFHNLEPTFVQPPGGDRAERPSLRDWLISVTFPPPGKHPAQPVPSLPLDSAALLAQDGRFAWLGHSSVLMRVGGRTLLTDPVFHRASPIPLGGKPFALTHPPSAAAMPALDAVLISHDHYDHLDWQAIGQLKDKTAHFFVPLGVKAHLQRWGVASDKITELDWHESATLGALRLSLAPARHFSGRNFTLRNRTLWGAWVIQAPDLSVYFSGDSGFGRHFALNGERYGPFDIAFMENGAYNAAWADIHMTPEESVQASRLLRARQVVPMHWGKFDLAFHPWTEPIERFTAEAARQQLPVLTPRIGQMFDLAQPPRQRWWEGERTHP